MKDTVRCPYCGHKNELKAFEDDIIEIECEKCKEEFEVEVEYWPSFNTRKKELCPRCGKLGVLRTVSQKQNDNSVICSTCADEEHFETWRKEEDERCLK